MSDPVLIKERKRKLFAALDEKQERQVSDAVKELKTEIKIESATPNTIELLNSYGYVYISEDTYKLRTIDKPATITNIFNQPLNQREQNEKICYNIFCLICLIFFLNMVNRVINWII